MNLFNELNRIMGSGTDVTIVVRKSENDRMVVSVNFRNSSVNDAAKDLIQPFLVKGTPSELDEGFVESIVTPLCESAGLQTSMQEFEAAKKVAESKSAALTEQKKKEAEEAKKRNEQYKKCVDAAKTAQNARKWKEAISSLTEAKKYAETSEIAKIEEGIKYCQAHDVPDLFGSSSDGDAAIFNAPAAEDPDDSDNDDEDVPE